MLVRALPAHYSPYTRPPITCTPRNEVENFKWRRANRNRDRSATLPIEKERLRWVDSIPSSESLKKVNIRVGKYLYQTREETLDRFPNTLLGTDMERKKFFDKTKNEFIFDRCYICFDAILFYYQSKGILSRPDNVKRCKFQQELKFFRINQYVDYNTSHNNSEQVNTNNACASENKDRLCSSLFQRTHYRFRNSFLIFYIGMVLLSAIVVCLEPTIPPIEIWISFELLLSFVFTMEYGIHICISDKKLHYMCSPWGVLDISSMLVSYIHILCTLTNQPTHFLSFVKFLLVIRVLKCAKISRGIREFIYVFWSSRDLINLFVGSALISSILTATLLEVFEHAQTQRHHGNNMAVNPGPVTFLNWLWYAIVTATGVGYGDYVPVTICGKVFGGLLCIIGVLIFSFPASQLVYRFVKEYYIPDIVQEGNQEKNTFLIEAVREEILELKEAFVS